MAAKFAFFPPNPPSYKVVTDNMTGLLLLTLFPHRKNVFGTRWQRQPCSTPTATQLILARCTSSSSNSASTSALTSWGGFYVFLQFRPPPPPPLPFFSFPQSLCSASSFFLRAFQQVLVFLIVINLELFVNVWFVDVDCRILLFCFFFRGAGGILT